MILLGDHKGTFSFPEQGSSFAEGVDWLFGWEYLISTIFFVLIVGVMVLFVALYRKRPGHERPIPSSSHNMTLEIAWTVLPCFLLVWFFVQGAYGYLEMRNPPDSCKEVWVTARQWSWSFHYPEEGPSEELHFALNQPVKLRLASEDVLHSFFIPEFRQKMDIIPGRYVWLWFTPTKVADFESPFHLRCTEYCGTGHSAKAMSQRPVYVHDKTWEEVLKDYIRWDESAKTDVENGERYYNMLCAGCHSIEDKVKEVGPSFKGYYGQTVNFTDGSSGIVDDNYIMESILEPNKLVRTGYAAPNGTSPMPAAFNGGPLNQDQIRYLTAFIRKLNGLGESSTTDEKAKDDKTSEAENK